MKLNFLKGILTSLQWLLLVLSGVAIILTLLKGFSLSFDISSEGFQYYLEFFEPYSLLFGATFVVLTTNVAIERLGLLIESSRATYKIGNRTAWIETANYFINEVSDNDSYMIKVFKRNILNIHDFLFEINYKFSSKDDLKKFFDQFIMNNVGFFEQLNQRHIGMGGIYRDEDYTYSYESLRYIFVNITKIEESYQSVENDLKELFITEVKNQPNRLVNRETFRHANERYSMEKFNQKRT